MKTVYAFIKYQGNSLAVDFPLNICNMFDHLGSIGIWESPSNVTIADTKDVAVRLTPLLLSVTIMWILTMCRKR